MKKIKRIKQLQAEKDRLEQGQLDLANKIGSNWKELKTSLKLVNMVKDMFSSMIKNKTEDNLNGGNNFKNSFLYALSLAKKITARFGQKFSNLTKN